jgi:anti-sigma regulatory factor (Ser/Thr protein kinase)
VKTASIQVESRTERLIAVRDFVSEAARAFGFGDEDISKIALAVDEACTNVIKHAYRFDPTKVIRVRISLMWSAVRLPGRMPGMKPPYFLRLSATSTGLNVTAV